MINTMSDIKLLKVQEVMTILKVGKRTVYNYIEEGKLDASKMSGRAYRITEDSVVRLVNEGLNK